jgi:hypothetical protein
VTTDDEYRDASKRTPDRVTLPKVVQGVRLSSPGEQPKPPLQSYEQTPPASPEARARARRNTLAGMPALAPPVTLPPPPVASRGYKRSVSPIPWDDSPAARREAERQGDRVVEAPRSIPPPSATATPLVVSRTGPLPWWEREEGVVKVLAGIGALITGVLIALGTYRATAPAPPPPPPPPDITCPKADDEKTPRGALCWRLHWAEEALGDVQARLNSMRAEREREKKMLAQEPPTLK